MPIGHFAGIVDGCTCQGNGKRYVEREYCDSDEDSDHPLVFAPVRSRRRVITPRTPSPPPRMSLDLIVKLFVTLSISGSGNPQMIHYDFFVNGNRFWVLSGFHRQQGVGGKFAVYETEEGAVIAKGMAGCQTLSLPHRVFVAAEQGATSVDLCPGERYFNAEPSSGVNNKPHSVKSLLTSIGVSCRKYTCVRMNTMVLAYVGMYDREKAAGRKGGRHLVIGYVWFSLRAVDYEFLFSVGIQICEYEGSSRWIHGRRNIGRTWLRIIQGIIRRR